MNADHARIALDYAHGTGMTALAVAHNLSRARIWQIVERHCKRHGMSIEAARRNPEELALRTRYRHPPLWVMPQAAQTPEEFFWELAREREQDAARKTGPSFKG